MDVVFQLGGRSEFPCVQSGASGGCDRVDFEQWACMLKESILFWVIPPVDLGAGLVFNLTDIDARVP